MNSTEFEALLDANPPAPEQLQLLPVDEDQVYCDMAARLRKEHCECGEGPPCFPCVMADAMDQLVGERGMWATMIDEAHVSLAASEKAAKDNDNAWRAAFNDLGGRFTRLEEEYQRLAQQHASLIAS